MAEDETTVDSTDTESEETVDVDGDGEATEAGGDDGGGSGMLGELRIPSAGRLLVGLGGAVMALSALFSWVEVGPDAFPNLSGIGFTTVGVGLAVFLVGLTLLMGCKSAAVNLGLALGAFAIALIYIVLVETDSDLLALGAWLGLVGTSVAVLGALLRMGDSQEEAALQVRPPAVLIGAALAVVASFWLDWVVGPIFWVRINDPDSFDYFDMLNGLDLDVLFGFPVLILGGIALVSLVELLSVPQAVLQGRRQVFIKTAQICGVAITVIAGANVLGNVVGQVDSFGSGPLVALIGGLLIVGSVRKVEAPEEVAPNQ